TSAPCRRRTRAGDVSRLTSLHGLLEPRCPESGRVRFLGGPAQRCAGATRPRPGRGLTLWKLVNPRLGSRRVRTPAASVALAQLRPLWALPLQQFAYRQLMYLVLIRSAVTALAGTRLRWHKLHRSGSASEAAPAFAAPIPAAIAGPHPAATLASPTTAILTHVGTVALPRGWTG